MTTAPDAITLSSLTLDCADAAGLAEFYAGITGGTVSVRSASWSVVTLPEGQLAFQGVPGYRPPRWPDPASSIQAHLDFYVEDRRATEERVLAAGATRYDFQPNDDHCTVYRDPAGHAFCLSTWR